MQNSKLQFKIQNSSAFTLIEILIATFIFAITVVIVFAIFSSSTSYQAKTKVVRETTQASRYFVEEIARQVRTASGFRILKDGVDKTGTSETGNQLEISGKTYKLLTNPSRIVMVENSGTPDEKTSDVTNPAEVLVTKLEFEHPLKPGETTRSATTVDSDGLTVMTTIKEKTGVAKMTERGVITLKTTVYGRPYGQVSPPGGGGTQTIVIQTGVEDTYLDKNAPNRSYGNIFEILVTAEQNAITPGEKRGLIKFALPPKLKPPITINEATLSLYSDADYGFRVNVYRITNLWTEDATWNTKNGVDIWINPGGDFENTVVASAFRNDVGFYDFIVTDLVRKWVNDPLIYPNYGFYLAPGTIIGGKRFFSSNTADSSKTPKLTITYTIP